MREKTPQITSATAADAMRVSVSLKTLTNATLFSQVAVEEWGSGQCRPGRSI